MIPTVADVVALPVVQRGEPEIVNGNHMDRRVRWLHVSDLPDLSNWLQGGELVLTTGSALRSSPRTYLSRLARAGATGLVVELGTHISALPATAGRIAESLDMPLIALHREIKFVEVTEAVHRMIVSDQYEELAFAHHAHETFTNLSMKRASLADIVGATAEMLDDSVVLEDLSHQVLAISARGEPAAVVLRNWQRRSRSAIDGQNAAQETWTVTTVGPRAEEWGRLIVPRPPGDPGRTKMALERAAQALALLRMAEQGRFGLEHQAHSGLIDDVLQGRIPDDREAEARANALGLSAVSTYLPATVRINAPRDRLEPVAVQRRNVRVLDAVAHSVNSQGHTGLFSIRRDTEIGLVLAIAQRHGVSEDTRMARLGDALHDAVRRSGETDKVVFALGSPATTFVDAVHGLRGAGHVAEVALAMPGAERPFFRASDVRLRGLLALLRDDPRVQNFAETELKTLLLRDAEHGEPNLSVLRGYLELAGNKSALAKRLHMGRPTLYSRLATIQRILGVDLDDGESRASLHVALLIIDGHDAAVPHA